MRGVWFTCGRKAGQSRQLASVMYSVCGVYSAYCTVLYCVLVPSFSSRLSQQEPVLPAPDIYISTDAGGGQDHRT